MEDYIPTTIVDDVPVRFMSNHMVRLLLVIIDHYHYHRHHPLAIPDVKSLLPINEEKVIVNQNKRVIIPVIVAGGVEVCPTTLKKTQQQQ